MAKENSVWKYHPPTRVITGGVRSFCMLNSPVNVSRRPRDSTVSTWAGLHKIEHRRAMGPEDFEAEVVTNVHLFCLTRQVRVIILRKARSVLYAPQYLTVRAIVRHIFIIAHL